MHLQYNPFPHLPLHLQSPLFTYKAHPPHTTSLTLHRSHPPNPIIQHKQPSPSPLHSPATTFSTSSP
ncbi:hypothetical protein N431DRAFT_437723 [Stipitochalara longipes BDJ]|nr:hypothetical protein N431DRAFT_437723 [Stipitochalara longipes BDJ]